MYFPKSKIVPNLYSNGELSIASTGETYYGYYFEVSGQSYFTGKEPNDGENIALIKIGDLFPTSRDLQGIDSNQIKDLRYTGFQNRAYSTLVDATLQTNYPVSYYPQPTEGDYQTGEITRFFAKKRNENIYYEVQDTSVSSNPIYAVFSLQWVISGKEDIVSSINKNTVSLYMRQLPIPAFDKFLKNDYLKFWKPS